MLSLVLSGCGGSSVEKGETASLPHEAEGTLTTPVTEVESPCPEPGGVAFPELSEEVSIATPCPFAGTALRDSVSSGGGLLLASLEPCGGAGETYAVVGAGTLDIQWLVEPRGEFRQLGWSDIRLGSDGIERLAVADFDAPDDATTMLYEATSGATLGSVAAYDGSLGGQVEYAADRLYVGDALVDDQRGRLYVFPASTTGAVTTDDALAVHHGWAESLNLGDSFEPIGDVDGDGIEDVVFDLVVAWYVSGVELDQDEAAENGESLWINPRTDDTPISAVGDHDGDGLDDFAILTESMEVDIGGHLEVFSGSTRIPYATLYDGSAGWSVLRAHLGSLGPVADDGSDVFAIGVENEDEYEGEATWLLGGRFCGTQSIDEVGEVWRPASDPPAEVQLVTDGILVLDVDLGDERALRALSF